MKNKLFLLGIGVMVALSFVFIACEDPIYRLEPSTLPGPGNLTANIEYEGIVILKWDNVTSASNYKVVRRDTEKKVEVVLNASVVNNYYVDVVSHTNELVNGLEYEYAVISNSGNAHLQNGRSTVKASPSIPATFTPVITAEDVTVERFTTVSGADQIRVKIANKPNLTYQVAYTFGTGTIVRDFENFGSALSAVNWNVPYYTTTYPTFGGKTSVSVKAYFRDSSYYTTTALQTKEADFVVNTLASPTTFTAVQYMTGISIRWSDVEDATGYKVYKAKISDSANNPNISTSSSPITILSDWALVTGNQTAPETRAADLWEIYEDITDATGNYIYAIIAENATAKSAPKYTVATNTTVAAPSFTVTAAANDKVEITWTASADVTYTLERAEVVNYGNRGIEPNTSNYTISGSWAAVSPALVPADYEQGRGEYTDTPAPGKAYAYRLTASRSNTSASSVQILNTGRFRNALYFSLTRVTQNNALARDLTLRIQNQSGAYDGNDLTFDLYRGIATSGSQTSFEKVNTTPIAYAKLSSTQDPAVVGSGQGITFTDTGLDPALDYDYKIVVLTDNSWIANNFGTLSNQQPNGNYATLNITQGSAANTIQLAPATTASEVVTLPVKALHVGTGTLQAPATGSTGTTTNNGPNIEGLSVTVRYNTATTGAAVTKDASVTVTKSVSIGNTTGTAPNATFTTTYYYIIQLPLDATAGQVSVRYPWSTTFSNIGNLSN